MKDWVLFSLACAMVFWPFWIVVSIQVKDKEPKTSPRMCLIQSIVCTVLCIVVATGVRMLVKL